MLFELRYRKEPMKVSRNRWVSDPEMAYLLPDRPPQFAPLVATYGEVCRRAVQLNEAQIRYGFLHYLFFPETHGGTPCSCDLCRNSQK